MWSSRTALPPSTNFPFYQLLQTATPATGSVAVHILKPCRIVYIQAIIITRTASATRHHDNVIFHLDDNCATLNLAILLLPSTNYA
jgi:hypothetical protein